MVRYSLQLTRKMAWSVFTRTQSSINLVRWSSVSIHRFKGDFIISLAHNLTRLCYFKTRLVSHSEATIVSISKLRLHGYSWLTQDNGLVEEAHSDRRADFLWSCLCDEGEVQWQRHLLFSTSFVMESSVNASRLGENARGSTLTTLTRCPTSSCERSYIPLNGKQKKKDKSYFGSDLRSAQNTIAQLGFWTGNQP